MITKFLLWVQASKKNLFLAVVLPVILSFLVYLPLKFYDNRLGARFVIIPCCVSFVCFCILLYSYAEKQEVNDNLKRQMPVEYAGQRLVFDQTSTKMIVGVSAWICILGSIVLALFYFTPSLSFGLRFGFLQRWLASFQEPKTFFIFPGGLLVIGLLLLLAYYARFAIDKVEVLSDRGLNVFGKGRMRFISWNEIVSLKSVVVPLRSHGAYLRTSEAHTIQLSNGEKFDFTSYLKDVYRLAKIIETKIKAS